MAIFAIGDVQGCFDELQALLELVNFRSGEDMLWFTGDLVNRGPQSLQVLRYVKNLGDSAVTVLGNHDLHLLAVAYSQAKLRKDDSLNDILQAHDREDLLTWLRHRPLLHSDARLGAYLIHAGLPPQWDIEQAKQYALEVESVLRGDEFVEYLSTMYGNKPSRWKTSLSGWSRIRFITNCFTRLRYVDNEGKLSLEAKGPIGSQPPQCMPWFQHPKRQTRDSLIVFGHWSTLGFYEKDSVIALDTGCLWGGKLTAVRLDADPLARGLAQIPCRGKREPKKRYKE